LALNPQHQLSEPWGGRAVIGAIDWLLELSRISERYQWHARRKANRVSQKVAHSHLSDSDRSSLRLRRYYLSQLGIVVDTQQNNTSRKGTVAEQTVLITLTLSSQLSDAVYQVSVAVRLQRHYSRLIKRI
jgi:hypothetical protein